MTTRFPRLARLGALAAALAMLAGCGKGTSTNPTILSQDQADDAALQVAAGLHVVGTDVSASGSAYVTGAPQAGLQQAQFDTVFVNNGITFEITRTFFDAAGDSLSGYGPTAVRLLWTSRAFGTFSTDRDTATVGHDAALDVRNIEAGKDTLDFAGFSNDSLQNVFRSYDGTRTRYAHVVSNATWADVMLLKNRTLDPWPLSGTMVWTLSIDRLRSNNVGDVASHFNATVTVTFNGTADPDITVNGVWRYKLDLITGAIVRV
ncbi:MAG TPA: hypothetical protein VFK69_01695 [Candidatus Eisenbacteria bacterium]|nr:hypothetical protein [Candidatus Eisenbacteria bacterium]